MGVPFHFSAIVWKKHAGPSRQLVHGSGGDARDWMQLEHEEPDAKKAGREEEGGGHVKQT